ncbi:hypothetical protein [Streptomyces sp. NPDC047130]|uniref:hypothetical protein n=1 Tax=Streptomyces sp. NPDC047130 TaxID=3155261 RepID=UPI0033E9FD66
MTQLIGPARNATRAQAVPLLPDHSDQGVLFGLVTECHADEDGEDGEDDRAELYPDRSGFSSPWNGEYDT